MASRLTWAAAATMVAAFVIMLAACIHMWGGEGGDRDKLVMSASLLSSALSALVLIFAALFRGGGEKPSERYRERFLDERK